MTARHEIIDLRLWDKDLSTWSALQPFKSFSLEHREDLSIDTLTVTLSDKFPHVERLREHKSVPVPVTMEINGVFWSGLVSKLTQNSEGDVTVTAASDDKHLHRLLARNRASVAVDADGADVSGKIGEVLVGLAQAAAHRTGLPFYTTMEHAGDPIKTQVRAENTVADLLGEALSGSDTFADVRVLLPGQKLPGEADVMRVKGPAEGVWEERRATLWPHAQTSPRIKRASVTSPVVPTPHLSWVSEGTIGADGRARAKTRGVCWVPFMEATSDRGYWQEQKPEGVRSATTAELQAAKRPGWEEHLTYWAPGVFSTAGDLALLDTTAKAGKLTTPAGNKLETAAAAKSYIGAGEARAWFTGRVWVLATAADFAAEDKRRNPTDPPRQVPGVLLRVHGGRDRRNIVFSSTTGGGLEAWETTTTTPEAAMIHAAAQLDEATLQAIKAGTTVISGNETATGVDVSAEPFATVAGTDISFAQLAGRVDVEQAGPFFYREMTLNLGSSTSNPVGEMGREWAKAQGSTTTTLTPGYGVGAVFGDDVKRGDRVIPGWKVGDRVSIVDETTRISEVVSGYSVRKEWNQPLQVFPILGRADNGVLDDLMKRVRKAEADAQRALLKSPRRVPAEEVDAVVDSNATVADAAGGVKELRDVLGGPGSGGTTLLAQLAAINAQIQGQGGTPQPGLLPMYIQMNTQLWQQQQIIDAQQDMVAAEQRERVEAHDHLLEATQEQISKISSGNWQMTLPGEGKFRVSGTSVEAVGTWVGEAIIDVTARDKRSVQSGDYGSTSFDTYPRYVKRVQVGASRSWAFSGDSIMSGLFYYRTVEGQVKRNDTRLPAQVAPQSWGTVNTFTTSYTGKHSIEFRIGWDAANYRSWYRMRILADGVEVALDVSKSLGPVLPLMDGYALQTIAKTLELKAGQKLEFQVEAEHKGDKQRAIRDGLTRIWWVEEQ